MPTMHSDSPVLRRLAGRLAPVRGSRSHRGARSIATLLLAAALPGCGGLTDPSILNRQPTSILVENQVWSDPRLVDGLLANDYNRLPEFATIASNTVGFAQFDEAMWTASNNDANNITAYSYDSWGNWDYGLVRDINIFIQKVDSASALPASNRKVLKAEGRFLRAYMYFELVKRMGGVPLVTQPYDYQVGSDPTSLQFPRSTEAQVYDFIGKELDDVKNDLPTTPNATRATKWAALAMKARAMLYAGSLAKYNSQAAQPITTPGGEVGIPAARAADYYAQALAAAQEIINGGQYQLYNTNPDKGENFYEAITKKQGNPEVIWAQDFTLSGKYHNFTYDNIPRSLREDNESGSTISPSLNLVESYEYLDGSPGTLKTTDARGDYVYYDRPQDVFANKDPRLYGTVIYPGATFRGRPVNVQAGVLVWNAAKNAYDEVLGSIGSTYTDGKLLTGYDGPHPIEPNITNTGFYIRKYLDSRAGSAQRGQGTDVWWIRYRYGEVLLNAAEAAFELGRGGEALGYLQQVRQRAGLPASSLTTVTINKIRNERRVELAFEDHRLYDMKRWRLAADVWNGSRSSPDAMVYGLWPYRVVRPGDPARDGKYVFIKRVPPRFTAPRFFRLGNYYSQISDAVLNANPKIVRNPFQ